MTLPLTKEMLAAAYEYLCLTPPFVRWNLPESEDVKFSVGKLRGRFAEYQWDGKCHTIKLASNAIAYTDTLMRMLAHEMIHAHLEQTGMESRAESADIHNAAFRKFAAQACKFHGWDPKAFF